MSASRDRVVWFALTCRCGGAMVPLGPPGLLPAKCPQCGVVRVEVVENVDKLQPDRPAN